MDPQEGIALLEWINSFPLPRQVEILEALSDGHIMWSILCDIDPEYFTGELLKGLNHTGQWITEWQNLKQIFNSLVSYITDRCDQPYPDGYTKIDLKAIASGSAPYEIVKFVKLILLAAISSPKADEYISRMPYLTTFTQTSIKNIIENMQSVSTTIADNEDFIDHPPSFPSELSAEAPNTASDIAFEERFAKIMASNDKLNKEKAGLQKDLGELHNRLARLQENNVTLQERLIEAEEHSQAKGSRYGANGDIPVEQLQFKIQQQDEFIADQEYKLFEYQNNAETMQKNLEKLKVSSGKSQKLRDELDEIRIERDNLAKKANTADKYKQKLQASQELEKTNKLLQEELDEMHDQLRAGDRAKQQVTSLQLTIEEYKRLLPKIETDRCDLQMIKKQLEFDNATLAQRCEKAKEQRVRDLSRIADLNGKISDHMIPQSPTTHAEGLSTEISQAAKIDEKLQVAEIVLFWSRLTARNRITKLEFHNKESKKSTDEQLAKNILQQQILDFKVDEADELEERLSKVARGKREAEGALAAMHGCEPVEGTEVYHRIRAERDAFGHSNAQLQAENELLRQHTGLQRDGGKVQRNLPRIQESAISNDEVRAAFEHLKAVAVNNLKDDSAEGQRALEKRIASLADMIIDGNTQQTQSQEAQTSDLQARAQKARVGDANHSLDSGSNSGNDGTQIKVAFLLTHITHRTNHKSKALTQELDILRRENKLMQSAYHDLGSRLQMNNVILQRRTEAPKSWINKQRRLVDQAALGIRS